MPHAIQNDAATLPEAAAPNVGVSFAGVSKDFRLPRGKVVTAIEDFDLTIGTGEFVALIGPSGCGKSTALRLAAGLERPLSGTVTVGGADPSLLARSHRLGVAFQEHALLPWLNVRRNLELPFRLARLPVDANRIDELIALVGLDGFADARPSQLSGGMRQRVSIARALALDPSLLLLDEPFGALDAVTRRRMNAELARIWSAHRITTLLVTHDVDEAVLLADRVIVMSGRPGRVAHEEKISFSRPRNSETMRSAPFHDIVDRLTGMLDGAGPS